MNPEWLQELQPKRQTAGGFVPEATLQPGPSWLKTLMNRPLINNPGPYQAEMQRFNPTMMQGKNLINEVMPGIGDAKAIEDAQQDIPMWAKALNYASVVPGVGDIARIGGNAAMPMIGAMTAFHGSPHKFSQFDMSKIGTGEGAQAYGHGLYFAESPGVAKSYQPSGRTIRMDGEILNPDWINVVNAGGRHPSVNYAVRALVDANLDISQARKSLLALADEKPNFARHYLSAAEKVDSVAPRLKIETGSLYEVDIPDTAIDNMLDWDAPLSEQPESVRKALEKAWLAHPEADSTLTGEQIYHQLLQADYGPTSIPEGASAALNDIGIPGIKYFDAGSRNTIGKWIARHPDGGQWEFNSRKELSEFIENNSEFAAIEPKQSRNLVVFDDKIPKILKRNEQPLK